VGQLRSSADLKPPRKPFQALADFLVGPKPASPLYGPRSVVRCVVGRAGKARRLNDEPRVGQARRLNDEPRAGGTTGSRRAGSLARRPNDPAPDADRLWIADPGGRCLHLFNLGDRSYRKIETVGGAHLLSPVGLCLGPEDSIYVCDSQSISVHRLSASTGALLATLRLPIEVQRPVAAGYEPATEELFVVDVCAHDIKVLGPDGTLRRIVGRRGDGAGEFNYPSDIAVGGGMIWIADTGNYRVQGLTQAGEHVVTIGQAGDAPGDFAMPKGIALDGEGHIYVVDGRFENVQVFDPEGRLLLFFGEEGSEPGEFWLPSGVFVDPGNRIWVCDSYNGRVQVFDYLAPATSGPRSPTPDPRSPFHKVDP
jgi:sugar lactone lactonase YvrE